MPDRSRGPFVVAHVSDFHVSTFGDTFHDRARIVRRSMHPADASPERFDLAWSEAGWRVLVAKGKQRPRVALVDPEGYSHPVPRSLRDTRDPVERAAAKACHLEARRAVTLAGAQPTDGALARLLEATPENSNVRFVGAARGVVADRPDVVAITGDMTDDGDGYDLVYSGFGEWAARGMLLAVPGNHDLYGFPMAGSGRPRATPESKRAAWTRFAGRLGLDLDRTGAWFRAFGWAETAVVGLDSCARPQRRFFRHNGAIGEEQMAYLRRVAAGREWRAARHRVVMLHHHVVPLPHGIGRRAPSEFGMRLDDATAVAALLDEIGTTLVMHGHRHVSEQRQPAGSNLHILAAPSLTLGCRSGDGPSFWRVELGEHANIRRVHIPVAALPHGETADAEGAG